MRRRTRLAVAAAALAGAAVVAVPTVASAGTDSPAGKGSCAEQFDEAQRVDMESFRDYDLETWLAGHDDDAIQILTSGHITQGREAIGQLMAGHFTNREAIWSWTELNRTVDGCKTATIVYDATYEIPSRDFVLHEIVTVVYTYKHGKWLTVVDQGTELPE